jgi:hypothetical protein
MLVDIELSVEAYSTSGGALVNNLERVELQLETRTKSNERRVSALIFSTFDLTVFWIQISITY